VVLRVNGVEAFHKESVNTRIQIGYADSIELHIEEGPVEIEVSLPLMDLSETIVLQVSAPVYVGISTGNNEIDYQVSDEPFGYL
jgi:hypothetical protein